MNVDDVDDLTAAVCGLHNVIDHASGRAAQPVLIRMTPGPRAADRGHRRGRRLRRGRQDFGKGSRLSREGGLGLYLVFQYMDEVKIESAPGSGTRVIMKKRLAG